MFIVIWNYNSRDAHISVNTHGFIEEFATEEEAREDSELCKDHEHYRTYKIVEIN